jgi:hypothetical protein
MKKYSTSCKKSKLHLHLLYMDFHLKWADVLAGNIRTMSTQHCAHTTSITQTWQQGILCCATLVALPPLVCCPLCLANSLSWRLHLLLRYCSPLVQLVVLLPSGLPPLLSQRLCLSSRLSICWLLHRATSNHPAPWPPLPLSSHLILLLCPSSLVGCCVVLPSTLASLLLLSSLCLARWPLIILLPLVTPLRFCFVGCYIAQHLGLPPPIRSAKQDDDYGASNIILPCLGS